jgi:membrane protein
VTEDLTRRIEALLWRRELAGRSLALRACVGVLRFLYVLLRDVMTGPLTLHAMGLVYVTILSLVPLLAVGFSVLKAFGFHRQIEPAIGQFLAPLGERGAELTARILEFVDNAQGNVLAGLGLLFLFFTAVSMAEQVEGSLNKIWRVERPRSIGRRMSEYLSVILVGPVVMVTAMALIADLSRTTLAEELTVPTWPQPLRHLAPYALVCLGFSFVYWFVPNTRVSARAALAGGLTGGVLWAGTGVLFATFVVNATTTISIYATFAIVISALLWLYLCWLILLVGAQVAFYVQHGDYMRIGYRVPHTGTGTLETAALAVMHLVARTFRDGGGATSIADIAAATALPGIALSPVIARLQAAGLIERTSDERLLPRRDPSRILLRDIVHAVRHAPRADIWPETRWPGQVEELSLRLETVLENSLGGQTLAELLDSASQAPQTPA